MLTGSARGRKLKVPSGMVVRPTTGRVKQSMFDTLGGIKGARVLDVFSGAGTLGIEALSRGASYCVFIERSSRVARLLRENVETCGFLERSKIICRHYESALKKLVQSSEEFDLIFIDPPYPMYSTLTPSRFVRKVYPLLSSRGVIVIKHVDSFGNPPEGLDLETRSFGYTKVSFLRKVQ